MPVVLPDSSWIMVLEPQVRTSAEQPAPAYEFAQSRFRRADLGHR